MKQTITVIAMILFLAITINVEADDSVYSYAGMAAANTHIYKSSYKVSGKGADMAMFTWSECGSGSFIFVLLKLFSMTLPELPFATMPATFIYILTTTVAEALVTQTVTSN